MVAYATVSTSISYSDARLLAGIYITQSVSASLAQALSE